VTGRQLIALTRASLRPRRLGKPAVSVHPFFRTWLRGHRAELRAAIGDPAAEIEIDLEHLWRDCGFELHDELLVWWAHHADGRGFEGDGELPPWFDEDRTLALLSKARDWAPRPVGEPEQTLSRAEERRRLRELQRMERAVLRETALRYLERCAAWGRRPW
jgi:hypothetical protein